MAASDKGKPVSSEKQLLRTLDNMLEGIQIHDFQWRYTYVNDTLAKYSGYAKKELLGFTLMEKYPGIEQTDLFKTMQHCMDTRAAKHFETEFIFPDGSKKEFELSIQPIPEGIFILSIDISERKKAETTIEQRTKMLAAIYDTTADIIFVIEVEKNESYKFSSVNKAFEITTGIPYEAVVGKYVDEIIPETSLKAVKKRYLEAIEGRKNIIWEETSEYPAGTRTGIVNIAPYFNKEGDCVQLIGTVHDITQRKSDEEKLKNTLQKLTSAQEVAHVGSWELNFSTGIVSWSDEACKIHGVSLAENQQTLASWISFVHPEDRVHVKKEVEKSLALHIEYSTEHRIISRDGRIKYINSIAKFDFNSEGKAISAYGVFHDITEQKKLYTEIKKSELKIRNFAKHLTGMQEEERAHIAREIHDELGQELVGIKIGLSSFINKNTSPVEIESSVKEMMKTVDNAIQSLRKIATELRPGILDTLGLMSSIEWLGKEFERKTQIKCVMDLNIKDQNIEKDISISFFRICQEALTNVSKHAECSMVTIILSQSSSELKMEIIDDGKGIASDKLENPFSMGMLGMHERANNIGGSLEVKSEKDKGTIIELKVKIN